MVFAIDEDVFGKLPTLCVGMVVAEGLDNRKARPEVDRLLDEAVAEAQTRLAGMNASEDPRVQPYRAAFHELGMSPSRYPSSNIALLRRIAKGKGLWRVNPLVDLGNVISISYGLPLGAHAMVDTAHMLELRFSRAGDVFVALGTSEPDETLQPGELVYAEGNLIHTRRWTWRQSENGKIEASTQRVLFPIDGFVGVNDDQVRAACAALAGHLQAIFGCSAEVLLADAATPVV